MRVLAPEELKETFGTQKARALVGAMIGACATTHIYCRPLCPAGAHVNWGNVRTFPSPAAAEDVGFRPCLTCCPESAPTPSVELGYSPEAVAFAAAVEAGIAEPSDEALVTAAFKAAGLSVAQSEAMVNEQFGTTAAGFVRTARRLAAKRMMRESVTSVEDVAATCGYVSGQALVDDFATAYKLDARKLDGQRPRKPRVSKLEQK